MWWIAMMARPVQGSRLNSCPMLRADGASVYLPLSILDWSPAALGWLRGK